MTDAALLSRLKTVDAAMPVAAQLVQSLSEPFELPQSHDREPLTVYVTGSVGIALYLSDGEEPDELLKHADIAMSRAKDSGRNQYQFFQRTGRGRGRKRPAAYARAARTFNT